MQLEKDQTALIPESADDALERDTEWLLSRDMSDQVDNSLFTVPEEHVEATLTAYEAEIAGRPMFRGHGEGDDLSSMVEEEIVGTEVGGESDIYTASSSGSLDAEKATAPLAVDHTVAYGAADVAPEGSVPDGADILSLSDDDDIGDHHLVLVQAGAPPKPEPKIQTVQEPELELSDEPELTADTEQPEEEFEFVLESDLESAARIELETTASPDTDTDPVAGLDIDAELDLGAGLDIDAELDLGAGPDIDAELDLGPAVEFETLPDIEFDLSMASDLEIESDLDLSQDFDIGLELDLEPIPEGISAADPVAEIELDSEFDLGTDFAINDELSDELNLEPDAVSDEIPESEPDTKVESVLDYIASTPAPTDETEFDEFLLAGQEFEDTSAESANLTVAHTEGVTAVDPELDSGIDYHEDFQNIDGFNENALSAITGVIAQVMEEVTTAVDRRLAELSIDSDLVQVEAMLGNDVESIIECVTDGYSPIIEVRPELPAALRQLGQSGVDAIYIRISHSEIPGNWNGLFREDFVPPGSDAGFAASEAAEEDDSVQPFASFDLDEFDFDESVQSLGEDFVAKDLTDELDTFAELSSDDPLASIDFGTVADSETEESTEENNEAEQEAPLATPVEDDNSWCIPGDLRFTLSDAGSSELFEEFLDVFMEEATSELEKLEDAIGSWDANAENDSAVPATVSHTLHTLKGIAKGVGLHRYGTLIHNYETLLDGLSLTNTEDGRVEYFQVVNAWLDAVVRGFGTIESSRADIASELPTATKVPARGAPDVERVADKLVESGQASPATRVQAKSTQSNTAEVHTPTPTLRDAPVAKPASVAQTDTQLADEGAKTLAAQQTIRMTSEALDNLLNLTNQAQQLGVRSSESAVRSKLAAAESLARLSAVRAHIVKIADRALSNVTAKDQRKGSELDALEMDQYSELQEAANILRESVEDLDDLIRVSSRQISMSEALLKQQSTVISSLGSSIQAVRVVPVSRLFPGLRRIVRTVGADLGKTVSFKVLKQVGTLDRDNYARCQVILEHMVRNAMDHGIESPEERLEQGKPASGTISVEVNKKGADYIITLSDDGRGVDPDLMRETAYRRGLDIDVDALSDDEAIRLIFHKGFSTASSVSEISGRGVGMDIVLSELQKIGGDVEVESSIGKGTSFHIRIPPNVSVNGALLVSVGERSYAIPLDGLMAVDNVDVDDFYEAIAQEKTLSLAGVECDPAYLATICHGESLPERGFWPKSVPVLIGGSEERYMAIAVDDVKQALELVIRSLGVQFSAVPGVAGATTTVDGQAVVALDLNALVNSVGFEEASSISPEQEVAEQLLVLVVDDSRTQRMVSTSQFDTLGVETITAENGMVAIDLLNTTHRLPDVILLDVEMPVKDGIQTLREIRKSTRYPHIPVIMVTSRTGTKHRALADEAGCDGYMGKPFNFPVLVEQINQLTGQKLEIS